ncbi:MAG TPA: MBL fold metallo-hydrolase, partial [Usitatibacter sp.]|nr:MBL fold metallo-hydrolase [Usitatibacter sp.]
MKLSAQMTMVSLSRRGRRDVDRRLVVDRTYRERGSRMKRAILALAMSFVAGAWAQGKDEIREIGPGVSMIPGQFTRGRQPDGNSVVLLGTDGTIIIDTGRHREHTQRVLNVATRNGKKPIAVINTHWHLDHVGGNIIVRQAFPKA